ncbi:MAG: carbonic anhydrase [Pseudomonadota bacterium]
MHRVKALPPYLAERYRTWTETSFAENRAHFRKLADEGQNPGAMVIACCDSRVSVEPVFGPGPGETFIHRNIANLVPRHGSGDHGTGAAIEYAVNALKVSHLIVMGHSGCGGVKGCCDMCEGRAPELDKPGGHIGRWLDELRPAHALVADIGDPDAKLTAMEKEGVHVSLENLMGYPFVAEAVDQGRLRLHGLWVEIGAGAFESYDGHLKRFSPV